ncbi:MAG: hypothetical protein R3Y43_06835 [Alphaproteobacteria bacterium]
MSEKKSKNINKKFFDDVKANSAFYFAMLVMITLVSSFFYDLGFFVPMDWRMVSFLSLSDYYEGTIPFIISFFIVLLFFFLPYYLSLIDKSLYSAVKVMFISFKTIFLLVKYIKNIIKYFLKSVKIKYKLNVARKELSNVTFKDLTKKDKQNYNQILRIIKKLENELNSIVTDIKEIRRDLILSLKIILILIFRSTVFIFLFCVLPFNAFCSIYSNNFSVLAVIIFILIFTLLDSLFVLANAKFNRIVNHILFFTIIIFFLGAISISNNIKNENITAYIGKNYEQYSLIRKVSTGVFVKKENSFYFFPKEKVNYIEVEKLEKKKDSNHVKLLESIKEKAKNND